MKLRSCLAAVRHSVARRIVPSHPIETDYGTGTANSTRPAEHSPEALSARLDALEREWDARQAIHRLRIEQTLNHLR